MVKAALFILCHLKGLWKLDGTTLSNKAGITLTGNWLLPSGGRYGTIQNTDTGGYLTINGNTAAGSAVVEEALHNSYEWRRLRSHEVSGYFQLIHYASGKFLTGQSNGTPNSLTIEGNDFSFIQLPYRSCCLFY